VTLVPPTHWLLVQDTVPFRALLSFADGSASRHVESIAASGCHVAGFAPRQTATDARLMLERYTEKDQHVDAGIRFLSTEPDFVPASTRATDLVLLTNGRGAMARLRVDLGRVQSKYDCVLGANLHPTLPVDRHVFAKRIRVWVNADGFISPLDFRTLARFEAGPPAIWHYVAPAGDGRMVEIRICAGMLPGHNTTLFHFSSPTAEMASGKQLPGEADVRLTVRVDIEDRNFHWETKRNGGTEHHFASHIRPLSKACGFAFAPSHDRHLRIYADRGIYHPQPEWSENLPHPVEESRGQTGSGDAYSPGWFELPLPKGSNALLVITAEPTDPKLEELECFRNSFTNAGDLRLGQMQGTGGAKPRAEVYFEEQLRRAIQAFVVRRGEGKTVIAGYPWFLDWGRDTFICARGLLAAGLANEVKQLLITFARFEQNGTLPNTIFGEDAGNRDTSDAPLWFGLVCEELAEHCRLEGSEAAVRELYQTRVDSAGRTLLQVLENIVLNYVRGTPNGIRMDSSSALIWSPGHFTWMDTNYPAGTPREGYPVEIQALWIRLLKQLERLDGHSATTANEALSQRAMASLDQYFWREGQGYYADVLLAKSGQSAANATVDDALRSNYLFVVSLGLSSPERARACIYPALRHLVVPGALRTLAPLPVSVLLPIHSADGRPLSNPKEPYWGRYEGDEDTRRKPAYHNGTAWTWTFPTFCEALARAWDFSPEAVATARAYLGSMARLMGEGCLGQFPEIVDGDAPHTPRGCDAQAWAATEALRVWRLLARGR
jgi:predicted glycogen debranching enzyme